MIDLKNILKVAYFDHAIIEGKYKEEYHGRLIYSTELDSISIVSEDGTQYILIGSGLLSNGEVFFSPKELVDLIESTETTTNVDVGPTSCDDRCGKEEVNKSSIKDLLELKQQFTVDEIIRLKTEGLI